LRQQIIYCMARPAKTDEKRKDLLVKAVSCFSRFGYSKTTLDDVARAAKMNKATLYHYFKNKEELFLQVMLQVSSQGIEQLKEQTLKLKTPEKQLIYFFSERLHFYLQIVRLNSLTRENLLHLQSMFDAVYLPEKDKEIEFVAAILKDIQRKDAIGNARLLFAIADSLKHNGVFTGKLLDNDAEAVATTKEVIIKSITILLKGISQ
jgi:AcrR family transcriptional regulator